MTLQNYTPVEMTSGTKKIIAEIISTNVPTTFPSDGENVERLTKDHILYPGSTIYVVNGAKLYMMDESGNWIEQ